MTTSREAERRTVCNSLPRCLSYGRGDAELGAALLDQFLGAADRSRGVGGVPVRPDGVGILLGYGGTADHDDHLVAKSRLLEGVDVRLEHWHRRREEGRKSD